MSLSIAAPLGFVLIIIELRNIELTNSWWAHHIITYEGYSDKCVKFGIFLMSYGDYLKLGVLLIYMNTGKHQVNVLVNMSLGNGRCMILFD